MRDDESHDTAVLLLLCKTNVCATLASHLPCVPGHMAGGGVIEQLISALFLCFPEARALHLHPLHHSTVWCVTSWAEWLRFSLRHRALPSHSYKAPKWKITHCLFIIKADYGGGDLKHWVEVTSDEQPILDHIFPLGPTSVYISIYLFIYQTYQDFLTCCNTPQEVKPVHTPWRCNIQ